MEPRQSWAEQVADEEDKEDSLDKENNEVERHSSNAIVPFVFEAGRVTMHGLSSIVVVSLLVLDGVQDLSLVHFEGLESSHWGGKVWKLGRLDKNVGQRMPTLVSLLVGQSRVLFINECPFLKF